MSDMSMISTVLPYIQVVLSVILIGSILLQNSGATNGGALGGGDNMSSAFHTRRGFEKTLFIVSIVTAILFAISSFLSLVA